MSTFQDLTRARASGEITPGPVVVAEIRRVLACCLDAGAAEAPLEIRALKHRVYRVRPTSGAARSLIAKRLDATVARRNRLVMERWLPAIGLEAYAPALLGAVAAPDLEANWLIFEDVDGVPLKQRQDDASCVLAAIRPIAQLHTRAAGQPIVSECGSDDANLGMGYFTANVGGASELLQALRPPVVAVTRRQARLRDRLSRRLDALAAGQPARARLMADAGGPDTMLHGDLWTTNLLIVEQDGGLGARLIDWDHVGAGPICYDLSTLLYRFDRAARGWVLDAYRDAVADAGWRLPPIPELNLLSETAECARYANRVIWAAIALLNDGATWGFDELAEIDQWFEALEPVLDA